MTKIVLTIGGSDPFAGGGIQTDLKTFGDYHTFGISVLTSIVTLVDNNLAIHPVTKEVFLAQLKSIEQVNFSGIKIGLIANPEFIPLIKEFLQKHPNIPIILDPVLVFKEGNSAIEKEILAGIRGELAPLATLITPNLTEAEMLSKRKINSLQEMKEVAILLQNEYKTAVLIKGGGRLAGECAIDLLALPETKIVEYQAQKIKAITINGAGCSLSAAITAGLTKDKLEKAVSDAKGYVYKSIQAGVMVTAEFGSVYFEESIIKSNNLTA